jgi:NAD(P)-dependent dehydrogenase (short-subunit alcohol dehydrogenase family)
VHGPQSAEDGRVPHGRHAAGAVAGLALEFGPVCVNAVTPGLIDTPLRHITDGAERETIVQNRATTLSRRYVGTAEEVAQVLLRLMSNGYVTGEVRHVDGGGRCVSRRSSEPVDP